MKVDLHPRRLARGQPVPRRRLVLAGSFVLAMVAALYVVVPRLAGLDATWRRLSQGQPWWLAAALVFECLSFAGYVVLFRSVLARGSARIGWGESYQITMAGVVATRLLAAGGAGGVALTAWALRRAGLGARAVATRMTAFLVLLYSVYMFALLAIGAGLRTGLLPGPAPVGLTVVPAFFGGLVVAAALAFTAVPADLAARFRRPPGGTTRGARIVRGVAAVPAVIGQGVRDAVRLVRSGDPRLLGAPAWWAFDIAVLWACLRAFGAAPPVPVVVMAYFVGMLGNLLPLPGGVGGVDGGMIAALAGFGVAGGAALVAVLVYRGFAFWLPLAPGAVAYVQLLRTVHVWQGTGSADGSRSA